MKKVLSLGGGVDSFAMLLDAIDRKELPELVIFANVGSEKADDGYNSDGEWEGTLRHVREVVMPLCEFHGIEFVWVNSEDYPIRGESSLLAYFEKKTIMPSRMSRLCTNAAKVERICDYLSTTYPETIFEVWIGFEAGEENRVAQDPHAKKVGGKPSRINRFPLIEGGFCRCRCVDLIRRRGFPIPRKSACFFCPFSSRGDFQTLRREQPKAFERTANLEANCKRTKKGKRITFGYKKGDDTDPSLSEWIEKPYRARKIQCQVCGAEERASKATGCGYLEELAPALQLAELGQAELWR